MPIKLHTVKGNAVEVSCSLDIAMMLGAVPTDGHNSGEWLLVRAGGRQYIWRLEPKATER